MWIRRARATPRLHQLTALTPIVMATLVVTGCNATDASPPAESGAVDSPAPLTTSPGDLGQPITVDPPGVIARTLIDIARDGAYRTQDQPCPFVPDSVISPYVPIDTFPDVQISRMESGATVVAVCRWTDVRSSIEVSAVWYPPEGITTQIIDLIRSESETVVPDFGLVAGFDGDGGLRVLTSDGVNLYVAGVSITKADATVIVSALVAAG